MTSNIELSFTFFNELLLQALIAKPGASCSTSSATWKTFDGNITIFLMNHCGDVKIKVLGFLQFTFILAVLKLPLSC